MAVHILIPSAVRSSEDSDWPHVRPQVEKRPCSCVLCEMLSWHRKLRCQLSKPLLCYQYPITTSLTTTNLPFTTKWRVLALLRFRMLMVSLFCSDIDNKSNSSVTDTAFKQHFTVQFLVVVCLIHLSNKCDPATPRRRPQQDACLGTIVRVHRSKVMKIRVSCSLCGSPSTVSWLPCVDSLWTVDSSPLFYWLLGLEKKWFNWDYISGRVTLSGHQFRGVLILLSTSRHECLKDAIKFQSRVTDVTVSSLSVRTVRQSLWPGQDGWQSIRYRPWHCSC